jgi:hypothetical protein
MSGWGGSKWGSGSSWGGSGSGKGDSWSGGGGGKGKGKGGGWGTPSWGKGGRDKDSWGNSGSWGGGGGGAMAAVGQLTELIGHREWKAEQAEEAAKKEAEEKKAREAKEWEAEQARKAREEFQKEMKTSQDAFFKKFEQRTSPGKPRVNEHGEEEEEEDETTTPKRRKTSSPAAAPGPPTHSNTSYRDALRPAAARQQAAAAPCDPVEWRDWRCNKKQASAIATYFGGVISGDDIVDGPLIDIAEELEKRDVGPNKELRTKICALTGRTAPIRWAKVDLLVAILVHFGSVP